MAQNVFSTYVSEAQPKKPTKLAVRASTTQLPPGPNLCPADRHVQPLPPCVLVSGYWRIFSYYDSCNKREHLIGPRHLHFPRASDEQLTSSSTSTWLLELGGSKAFLKPRAISTLKKELFHSPFSGGYAASFCGNSASATNAAEDKEAGGRAKAAAMRGAAEGRWSAERGGRSGGIVPR